MQLFSNIAQLFTLSPPSTNRRSDPGTTNLDPLASHGVEEAEEPEARSSIDAPRVFFSNVVDKKPTFLSRARPSGRSDMRRGLEVSPDERRLFPTYTTKRSDNGVPIIPGQTFQNHAAKSSVKKHDPFRPVDRITPRGNDSGPVRAYGKSITKSSTARSPSSRYLLSSPTLLDNENRVLKRRRHSPDEVIDLEADDNILPIQRGFHRKQTPSAVSTGSAEERDTKQDSTRTFKVPEDDDFQKISTEAEPTNQQDLGKLHHGIRVPQRNGLKSEESLQNHKTYKNSILTVDIEDNDIHSPTEDIKRRFSPVAQGKVQDRKHWDSDASESPDELQITLAVQNPRNFAPRRRIIDSNLSLKDGKEKIFRRVNHRISPSDIRPTVFNTSNKILNKRRPKNEQSTRSHRHLFDVKFFRYGDTKIEGRSTQLFLDEGNNTIGLVAASESSPSEVISIQRIISMQLGTDDSLKSRLKLSKVESSVNQDSVDIEFENSQDKDHVCGLLKEKGVACKERPGDWMDKAFNNVTKVEPRHGKRPSTPDVPETTDALKPEPSKRRKISKTLQGEGEDEFISGIKQRPRRFPLPITQSSSGTHGTELPTRHDEGISIPVKTYKALSGERETRSKTRQGVVDLVDNKSISSTTSVSSGNGIWSKPLVYPREGKKKAEVDSNDLERLRDGEFLNDNLIGLYLRFLEHHLERNKPEVSKRVYFFNSYFFATLTNTGKGKKGVNYEAVQKWTRNVDLFSHDYVVVPINESAHWYLALICNLSTLRKRENSVEPDVSQENVLDETNEIPETPPIQEVSNPEENTRESLASMKINDGASKSHEVPDSDDEWPEKEENLNTSHTAFRNETSEPLESNAIKNPEKGKKTKRTGIVYAVDQPTIITFDSLGAPRQPAIRFLRSYLMEEAGAKQSLELDSKDIKGMTAKEIPLQPNYSDCGLYLLAYLEKFVQDPDTFVRKLLQREMSAEDDWPSMKSGLLRRRLRKFLFELYKEQDSSTGTSLVDAQPISYLLGSSNVKSPEDIKQPEITPQIEPEVIQDSFLDHTKADDEQQALDFDSFGEAVVRMTQLSPNPDERTTDPQHEKGASDSPSDNELIEREKAGKPDHSPRTPERQMANNSKTDLVNISSPESAINNATHSKAKDHGVSSRGNQADEDIFDEMFEYLSQDVVPPKGTTVEVQVPTIQVPGTPVARKTGKDRTSPRQKKAKKRSL